MGAKVSIVVTCFDLGAYLHEALASIPDDFEYGPVEVIVVDDGSTDPLTRTVVDGLDRQRYTVIVQPNMGLAKARNNGIARSSGEYIIPLDADNRLNAEGVRTAVRSLDLHADIDIAYGNAQFFGARSGQWVVAKFDLARLLRRNYIDACACFRRTVWERLNGYDEHMPHMGWEDWDMWLRASVLGMRFDHIGGTFFDYRVREGSMISDTNRHADVLTAYIFQKPALRNLASLRLEYIQLRDDAHRYPGVRGALRSAWSRLFHKRAR
jgi:glycosyltransferase involved in cell wall biosynthesis